jgi:hypothetical protein
MIGGCLKMGIRCQKGCVDFQQLRIIWEMLDPMPENIQGIDYDAAV